MLLDPRFQDPKDAGQGAVSAIDRNQNSMFRISWWNLVGPISLAVLAYSGQLGASPILNWMPINVTVLASSVVLICFIASFINNKFINPFILVALFMWVLLLLPAIWYVPGTYSSEKIFLIGTLMLLCLVAPFELLRLSLQRVAFLWSLVIIAILTGLLALTDGAAAAARVGLASETLILEGANTISTARIIGTGALILIAYSLQTYGSKLRKMLILTSGLILVLIMVFTGSRGPSAAIITGLLVFTLFSLTLERKRARSVFLLVIVSGLAVYYYGFQDNISNDRAFAWLFGERDTSTQARERLWETAAEFTLNSPSGSGWGGFSTIAGVPTSLQYPHNLFLELYVETGWLIATFVILVIGVSLVVLWRKSADPTVAIIFALAIFAVSNSLVSGDINDNRILWMLIAVGLLSNRFPSSLGGRGRKSIDLEFRATGSTN